MIKKMLVGLALVAVLAGGFACGGGGSSDDSVVERAEKGQPLSRRDRDRLEAVQERAASEGGDAAQ